MSTPMLDSALRYADNGWRVFPLFGIDRGACTCGMKCSSPGKHPRTKNGLKDATTDFEQITDWWTRHPNDNIAIATGPESGLWVVDVDNKKSVEVGNALVGVGEYSVRELEAENQPLPDTRYVETGGGGRHIYYQWAEGCSGNRANVRTGIDIRGDGGYVVAPPSAHLSGHNYAWVHEDVLPDQPPTWLVEVTKAAKVEAQDLGDDDVVVEGSRNQFLHALGVKYRHDLGLSEWKLYGLLMAHNHKQCRPPLESGEVARIAKNCAAYEYVPPLDLSEFSTPEEIPEIPEGGDLAISLYELMINPPEPPSPLVHGVLDCGTGALFGGQPNVGKSWLVMDMALAVASGQPWLQTYETEQGPVLMIDEEGTLYGQYERFKMLLDGRDYLSAVGLPLHVAIGTGVRLDTEVGITRARRMLERYRPRLVVIDSLVRMHSGDENNAQKMAKFFEITKGLMRTYDTTFLFTHHVRKPSLESNDPGDLIRGTTEIRAWPDTIFVATPGEDTQEVILHHVKARYGPRADEFKVRMQVDDTEKKAVISYTGEVEKEIRGASKVQSAILRHIQQASEQDVRGSGLSTLAHALGRTSRTTREHVQSLVQVGAVEGRHIDGEWYYAIVGNS